MLEREAASSEAGPDGSEAGPDAAQLEALARDARRALARGWRAEEEEEAPAGEEGQLAGDGSRGATRGGAALVRLEPFWDSLAPARGAGGARARALAHVTVPARAVAPVLALLRGAFPRGAGGGAWGLERAEAVAGGAGHFLVVALRPGLGVLEGGGAWAEKNAAPAHAAPALARALSAACPGVLFHCVEWARSRARLVIEMLAPGAAQLHAPEAAAAAADLAAQLRAADSALRRGAAGRAVFALAPVLEAARPPALAPRAAALAVASPLADFVAERRALADCLLPAARALFRARGASLYVPPPAPPPAPACPANKVRVCSHPAHSPPTTAAAARGRGARGAGVTRGGGGCRSWVDLRHGSAEQADSEERLGLVGPALAAPLCTLPLPGRWAAAPLALALAGHARGWVPRAGCAELRALALLEEPAGSDGPEPAAEPTTHTGQMTTEAAGLSAGEREVARFVAEGAEGALLLRGARLQASRGFRELPLSARLAFAPDENGSNPGAEGNGSNAGAEGGGAAEGGAAEGGAVARAAAAAGGRVARYEAKVAGFRCPTRAILRRARALRAELEAEERAARGFHDAEENQVRLSSEAGLFRSEAGLDTRGGPDSDARGRGRGRGRRGRWSGRSIGTSSRGCCARRRSR